MMRALVLAFFGTLMACSSHDDSDGKTSGNPSTNGSTNGGGGGNGVPVASTRVALDVKSFCNKAVTGCGDTSTKESDCEAMFAAVRVTQDCAHALLNATCADFTSGTGAVADCFPACSTPGVSACNGDGTLSVCGNASKALVYDCSATCSEVGKAGTGKCGTASGSQNQKCLCE